MTKYQLIFQEMSQDNQELFTKFGKIHDLYVQDERKWQSEFNTIGAEVLDIIRKYENKLCGKSEGGKYGKFSGNLSDKFWTMIRTVFPKIDFIGIKVK